MAATRRWQALSSMSRVNGSFGRRSIRRAPRVESELRHLSATVREQLLPSHLRHRGFTTEIAQLPIEPFTLCQERVTLMASIHKEFTVQASAANVWDVFRDIGAVHSRLAKQFVTDTRVEGESRVVTFSNGVAVRERIISVDDERRRLARGGRVAGNALQRVIPGVSGGRDPRPHRLDC